MRRLRRSGIGRDRRAAVSVMVALTMVPLISMASLATDALLWQVLRQRTQAAADSAAAAAAVQFAKDGIAGNAQTQAQAIAASMGYATAQVVVNIPPKTGPNSANANAIEVIVSKPLTQYLSAAFYSAGGSSIVSRAVSAASSTCRSDSGGNDTGGGSGTNFVLSNNETVTLPDMNGKTMTISGYGTVQFSHDANGAALIVDSSCVQTNSLGHDFNGSTFVDNYVPPGMNYVYIGHSLNNATFIGGSEGTGGVFNIGHDSNGSSFTFNICASCSSTGGGSFKLVE